MRELSLFLIPFFFLSGSSANEGIHDHSLKHVQKRHDIPLEFIMNSHEHSDIRRSVRPEKEHGLMGVQRLSSDKFVVRRDETPNTSDSSTEVVGDSNSVPDKFDQIQYDFMLPEGKSEKSTILAVVDFITKKHNVKPTFVVNFDENQWFDIGNVEKTKADNADVYKATVILKAGADVNILKTDGGLYKFVVEAQQEDVVLASTNISVDVLSLAPTTKRTRVVTVPTEPKLMESSTTPSEVVTPSEDEDLTSTSGAPTTIEPSTTTSELPEPEVTEEILTLGGSSESSEDSEPVTSTPTSSEDDDEESSGETTVVTTLPEDVDGSAEVPKPAQEDVDESSGDSEDVKPSSSAELLTSSTSEDQESPIDGPVTILPLKASDEGKIEALEAHLQLLGASGSSIDIPTDSRPGDVIRNIHVALQVQNGSKIGSDEFVELSTEPEGSLSIRPSRMLASEQASLFIASPDSLEKIQKVELVAKYAGSVIRLPVHIRAPRDHEESLGSEMLSLREIELAVMESAESGRTIGTVDGDMKILGSHDRFSLVGYDIILTCGQFDTDKCLQKDDRKTFILMLMPRNGTLAPLQVTIRVQQHANLRTSDDVIRISDNRIISPFAVITERTSKSIKLEGTASKFLGFVKAQDGLYQVIVVNSAASGRYNLQITLEDVQNPSVSVDVFVENSLSHAHFRKTKYEVVVDAEDVKNGKDLKLTQVELEGVPIDEAKIMILDGNPGWVTVEDYGGRVKVGVYHGSIYNGKFSIRIGAVDKKTWSILTETLLELDVKNGEDKVEKAPEAPRSRVIEATFDREKEDKFEIDLKSERLKLDLKSLFGIDEKGKRVAVEPISIEISKNMLKLEPASLRSLRVLGLTLKSSESPEQKISVLIRLVSSPEYLETVRKNAARPVYPDPWSRDDNVIHVEMNEELTPGQVVGVFPAVAPMSSESSPVRIDGEMREAFDFDEKTGELKVKQRIDFESLSENQKTFELTLTSGDVGFESVAILKVKVLDVDDNSPVINVGDLETVSLPENLPAGTKIAEFDVTDPDGSSSYQVSLSGKGSENYRANITDSGTLSIFVSETAHIDRELQDAHSLLVKVSDVSENSDTILLPIRILDVNDNAPEFEKKMYDVEAVEDWPRGVVLERVSARDADIGAASEVRYSIEGAPDVISVNSTSGVVTVSGDLWGMARDAPYKFDVVATDSGAPTMNSTAILSLRIRGKHEMMTETKIVFLDPKNGAQVMLKENIPLDSKIYTAKAELRGIASKTRGVVTYSLKDLLNDEKEARFAIDKKSGEIFAVKPIDYEEQSEYTLLITATNSEDESLTSSAILKIHVENLEDNEPKFLESSFPVFQVDKNVSKPTAIGRLTAFDPDRKPIYYHLLPTCGSEMSANFTIDPEFGEVIYHPKKASNEKKIELCFLATSQNDKDVSEVFFDGTAPNMRKVMVYFVDENMANTKAMHISGNQSISRVGDVLDRIEIPISLNEAPSVEFSLKHLQFVPANYELGRDMISPEGSVELNKKTGELVANGRILDTPQGVYTARIEQGQGNEAVKQLHHIRNDRKLRYVLAMSRNEFGANSEKLRRQILDAIGEKENGKQLEIYFDEPTMDKKNSTWTSVCFYLTRDNAILDDKQMTSLVSASNGHIAKLHHIFKVVNIDVCAPRATGGATSESTSSNQSTEIPLNTLILIGVVGLLIIALVALLVFVCCVSRYQRYLKQKTERMRCNSSAGSYYKSPNLIPPPPRYIHTPPLPPPPPPAAIAFY